MAEFDGITPESDLPLDGQTIEDATPLEGGAQDSLEGDQPGDPNDPQYKYWQGVYTRTRQRERQTHQANEEQRQQYADVLRNFYTSDEYALQVLRQRFPHLASRLSLDGAGGQSVPQQTSGAAREILAQRLGQDLGFLAGPLGDAMEQLIEQALARAVGPLQQETRDAREAQRRDARARALAEADSAFPGWEAQHGSAMQELEQFLASDQLVHPKYGNRYQVLLKMLSPDNARVDALRTMQDAARNRVTTGRAGRTITPDISKQIREAPNNSEAFRLAAQAALAELRRG